MPGGTEPREGAEKARNSEGSSSCPMYDIRRKWSPVDVDREGDLLRPERPCLRPGSQRDRQRPHGAVQRRLRSVRVGIEREDRPDEPRGSVDGERPSVVAKTAADVLDL